MSMIVLQVDGRRMHVDDGSLDFVTLTEGKWTTANGSRVREFTGILPRTTVGMKMGYMNLRVLKDLRLTGTDDWF